MSWERRGNRSYFYLAWKERGNLRRRYVGGDDDPFALLAAAEVEERRAAREAVREAVRREEQESSAALAPFLNYITATDELVRATLLAEGFYQADRHWRPRRARNHR